MGKIVNKAELSELFGITAATIDSMIRQGMPVKARAAGGAAGGFQIDVSEAIKWREEQVAKRLSDQLDTVNLDEARRRKIAAEAALAELDLALKRGDAISLEVASRSWAAMVTAFKYRCLAIPAKLAPISVAETSLVAVRSMLEREIHEALDELTHYEPEADI